MMFRTRLSISSLEIGALVKVLIHEFSSVVVQHIGSECTTENFAFEIETFWGCCVLIQIPNLFIYLFICFTFQ